jgi:hypothetical protein
LLQLIQLSKYEIKIQMDFNVIDSVINAVFFAQQKTVSGVVSDSSGPVPGVNVVVKGTKSGVQTNMDGRYSIKAKTGDDLVFSFVGMAETIKKSGATNTINVSMQSGESLSEVVVQTNFGYFSKIQGCYLLPFLLFRQTNCKTTPALTNALQGRQQVYKLRDLMETGAAAFVTVRGAVSITGGSAQAIYVVDGALLMDLRLGFEL